MTEIEIETYSESESDNESNVEYSVVILTPDDNNNNDSFSEICTNHKNGSPQHQNVENIESPNRNFRDFIDRQFTSNSRQKDIRSQPLPERRFDPPPLKFILKSAEGPFKTKEKYHYIKNSEKQKSCLLSPSQNSISKSSLFQRSIRAKGQENEQEIKIKTKPGFRINGEFDFDFNYLRTYSNITSNESDVNEKSDKDTEVEGFSLKCDTKHINENSKEIGSRINERIIEEEFKNTPKTMNRYELESVLHKFHIKSQELIAEIALFAEIGAFLDFSKGSKCYDRDKAEKLLLNSINKTEHLTKLEKKIRPLISFVLRNQRNILRKKDQ